VVYERCQKYLLDTHTLLWLFGDYNFLSEKVKNILNNKNNLFLVSYISFWEISIKNNLGKLPLQTTILELYDLTKKMNIKILNINIDSINKTNKLYLHHRDPFDRMLIAQAITENIPILSADVKFDLYTDIQRIW